MQERTLKDLFHLVRKVIPVEQELITITSEETVDVAFSLMKDKALSQLPVVEGSEVLGVFSYRSFADGVRNLPEKEMSSILSLPVEVFIEDLKFVGITDELPGLINELDLKDAVLVGGQENLLGIVTTIDALRYFYEVASAYVILQEIELSIRELIRIALTPPELSKCIGRSLSQHYKNQNRDLPTLLEELTFNDYVQIIRFQGTWKYFKPVFGGSVGITYTKLKKLPDLRNDIFHFKREITIEEHDILRDRRDWLSQRIRKVSVSMGKKND